MRHDSLTKSHRRKDKIEAKNCKGTLRLEFMTQVMQDMNCETYQGFTNEDEEQVVIEKPANWTWTVTFGRNDVASKG